MLGLLILQRHDERHIKKTVNVIEIIVIIEIRICNSNIDKTCMSLLITEHVVTCKCLSILVSNFKHSLIKDATSFAMKRHDLAL